MRERRRHFRVPKTASITCQEVSYPMGLAPETPVYMLDVSESGVKFEAATPIAVGAAVQLALVLDGWNCYKTGFSRHDEPVPALPLSALGRVVRCSPSKDGGNEIGVEFVDIWRDHWLAMKSCLEKEKEKLETSEGGKTSGQ